MPTLRRHLVLITLSFVALLAAWSVRADDDEAHESAAPRRAVPMLAEYQQECSACHIAFPPQMLPPSAWRHTMSGLSRHFGTDASLEPDQVRRLSAWLLQASSGNRASAQPVPPDNRITRTRWFLHEHDEVPTAVWRRASVKSPANCMACHQRADQGDFRERFIRIPR